jgi:hypothetical protein
LFPKNSPSAFFLTCKRDGLGEASEKEFTWMIGAHFWIFWTLPDLTSKFCSAEKKCQKIEKITEAEK